MEALKSELLAPDVWEELGAVHLEGVARPNEPLTDDERQTIDARLDELLAYAQANYDLSTRVVADLDARLTYVKAAARRLPRVDWANVAVGTLMGWLLSIALPPDAARELMRRLLQIVEAVTGMLHLLPPGP